MAGERRLYLERNCRLPESPAHSRRRNREGPASSKGLNSQRGFGPAVEPRRKSRPRSTSLHGSSPCKCQRLSTLRWDRLPPSRPSTKSGARAGGRRLSDRRLHRWLAGTSASAPSSHGVADLLRAESCTHLCEEPNSSESASRAGRAVASTETSSRSPSLDAPPTRRCPDPLGSCHAASLFPGNTDHTSVTGASCMSSPLSSSRCRTRSRAAGCAHHQRLGEREVRCGQGATRRRRASSHTGGNSHRFWPKYAPVWFVC